MKGVCTILKLHASAQLFLFGKKQISKDIFSATWYVVATV